MPPILVVAVFLLVTGWTAMIAAGILGLAISFPEAVVVAALARITLNRSLL